MSESIEAPAILTAVNGLLSKAADLLTESHAPTEEGYEAEREILGHIARAGKTLVSEKQRRYGEPLLCSVPGCKRPMIVRDGFPGCEEHREHFDAIAEVEAWEWTQKLVEPWLQVVEQIGSPELEQVMKKAQIEVVKTLNRAQERREKAKAEL